MEFLKCRDIRWKGPEKRNKPNVVATTAKHPDWRSQISRYGWMQPTYMRSVSFWGNLLPAAVLAPAVAICLKSLISYVFGKRTTARNQVTYVWREKYDFRSP